MSEDKMTCLLCGASLVSGKRWCKDMFGFYYCWECYWDDTPMPKREKE